MRHNQQKIKEFLSDMPKNRLPQGLSKSLEEKRQEILSRKVYADYLAEIRAKAAEYRETPIEAMKFSEFRLFADSGDREAYQKRYFARRGRLACLALAACFGKKRKIFLPSRTRFGRSVTSIPGPFRRTFGEILTKSADRLLTYSPPRPLPRLQKSAR